MQDDHKHRATKDRVRKDRVRRQNDERKKRERFLRSRLPLNADQEAKIKAQIRKIEEREAAEREDAE
jgi:hypothetical protein